MSTARQTSIGLKPISDRLVVKREDPQEVTEGGIVIPSTAQEKVARGTVVAVGPGKRKDDGEFAPVDVCPGDRVVFAKYAGDELEFDGETYLLLREQDVMAVIE